MKRYLKNEFLIEMTRKKIRRIYKYIKKSKEY